jgi:LacI family transcriptional regulator
MRQTPRARPAPSSTSASRIVLTIPGAGFGQEAVRLGIYRYARPTRPWDFLNLDIGPSAYEQAKHWMPHGGIGRAGRPDFTAAALSLRVPFVNLYGGTPFNRRLPQVGVDNRAIGRVGAHYLADLGFKHFAYFGLHADPASEDRGRAFVEALAERKLTAQVIDYKRHYPEVKIEAPLIHPEDAVLHRWLSQLPRPVGIFVCDDRRALQVSEACRHLGHHVPEEVAILGTGDHEVLCYEAFPPLSSISLPLEQEGYRAAELLDHLMRGGKTPAQPILLQPGGIKVRQSTDTLAVADTQVASALRYIRENACQGIEVDLVARHAGLNRRYLERRFRSYIQRSPFQEIRRVQMERVKDLLAQTDLTIDAIADQTGFGGRTRLTVEFSKHVGTSPGAYRKQFRYR